MQIEVVRNLRVSPFQPADEGALVELLSDREVYRMTLRIPHPYTPADARQWLSAVAERAELKDSCAIRCRSGELIGGIGLHPGKLAEARQAELGYWLGRPFWGQGIMTAVVQATVRHALEQLNLTKLIAEVFVLNQASARVLEKCGFNEEGLLRNHLVKDGELIDVRLFGLSR